MKSMLILIFSLMSSIAILARNNPLLEKWNTPYNTPPFQLIKSSDYTPALEEAMRVAKANVKQITESTEEPTFANTIVALERSSELLTQVATVLFNLNECNTDAELQKIVMDLIPKLTRYESEINTPALFNRVKKVYEKRGEFALKAEEKMLLEKTYIGLSRSEAGLEGEKAKRYTAIKEELGTLSQEFKQHVLTDNNNWYLHAVVVPDIVGLPQNLLESAAEEAKKRGLSGWVFTLDMPSYLPFMQYSERRDLRKEMWTAYNSRGNRKNENNNTEIIKKIVALRAELAALFGYSNYADFVLSERMAQNSMEVSTFIQNLYTYAKPAAIQDVGDIKNYAFQKDSTEQEGNTFNFRFDPWDFSYYSTQLKQEKYTIDLESLRPYFELNNVKNGVFLLFEKLYGLTFVENKNISVYHTDVTAYEVKDGKKTIGILYLDFFPRESKRGGAWMVPFRDQSRTKDSQFVVPIIQIACNFTKPTAQTPSLLTFDEYKTLLHEFGHAIHGLLSDVTYSSLSGTSVYRDFVELPSQIMENWATEKEFLDLFAKHYKTGETISEEMIIKMNKAQDFIEGYSCLRQLSLAKLDLSWHSISGPIQESVEEFEKKTLADYQLLPTVDGTLISTSFSHIFSGGYAVGYYGYKWAEVLDADAFDSFKKGGIFNKEVANKFRKEILSRGGTVHPMELYINFKGAKPNQNAFLKRSGFIN